jgi:hypothetical protein
MESRHLNCRVGHPGRGSGIVLLWLAVVLLGILASMFVPRFLAGGVERFDITSQ